MKKEAVYDEDSLVFFKRGTHVREKFSFCLEA